MNNKFQYAGLNWIPHTPGNPMPCLGDTLVQVLFADYEYFGDTVLAKTLRWDKRDSSGDIIGWHPIEEQPAWPNAYTTVETGTLRRVLDLLEAGDIEQAKHELRKELE